MASSCLLQSRWKAFEPRDAFWKMEPPAVTVTQGVLTLPPLAATRQRGSPGEVGVFFFRPPCLRGYTGGSSTMGIVNEEQKGSMLQMGKCKDQKMGKMDLFVVLLTPSSWPGHLAK